MRCDILLDIWLYGCVAGCGRTSQPTGREHPYSHARCRAAARTVGVRLATGMEKEDVLGFLAALASAAEPVDVHFMWRPQLTDPADELVLEAAMNGRASAIVTHNLRDFLPAARDFEIEVITPGVMLRRMRK